MKLIDGLFRYGETVAIDIDGKLYKRKVHYADGELFVEVNGKRIWEHNFPVKPKFDKSAYNTSYNKQHRTRFTASVPNKQGDEWKRYAADLGMSMNAFIIYCVEKEIHGNPD